MGRETTNDSTNLDLLRAMINGGFFVFNPETFDYLDDNLSVLECGPFKRFGCGRQLMVSRHPGFRQPMDTLREKQLLESLWVRGQAPWKVWS